MITDMPTIVIGERTTFVGRALARIIKNDTKGLVRIVQSDDTEQAKDFCKAYACNLAVAILDDLRYAAQVKTLAPQAKVVYLAHNTEAVRTAKKETHEVDSFSISGEVAKMLQEIRMHVQAVLLAQD